MKSIIIITGAGASMPYGFPSGSQLRDAIIGYWGSPTVGFFQKGIEYDDTKVLDRYLYRYLDSPDKAALVDHLEFGNFREQLRRQELASVDRFLELPRNERFVEVGLISTAAVIGSCQHASHNVLQLPSSDWEGHWFRGFLDLLDAGNGLKPCYIRLITFNYDVALETYLCQVLASRWSKTFAEVWEVLRSQLGFLHIYGDVSPPWSDEDWAAYEKNTDSWHKGAAKRLKIIAQGRDDDQNLSVARKWIAEAEAVFFYGFGYDHTNMRRLGLEDANLLCKGAKFFGTHMGIKNLPPGVTPVKRSTDAFWAEVRKHCGV